MKLLVRPCRVFFAALFALPGLLVSSGLASGATQYTITDLGTLGGAESWAYALNASGQVVGSAYLDAESYHAFLWEGGTMDDLGTLGGPLSWGDSINASGQVAGSADTSSSGPRHAFFYQAGTMENLGTLGGSQSEGYGINASGLVVGSAYTSINAEHAFLWVDDNANGEADEGEMRDLGTLGGTHSEAFGINSSGQVVGYAYITDNGCYHAFVWSDGDGDGQPDPGEMQDLDPLSELFSCAHAVNASGQVVGWAEGTSASGFGHAYLWENGQAYDLGALGGSYSEAWGINSSGQTVGYANTASEAKHAFLRTGGVMHDLNSLIPSGSGWTLAAASDINDSGQIVGWGFVDGEQRAFLLTPIPEPSAIGLAALAILALVRRLRRG